MLLGRRLVLRDTAEFQLSIVLYVCMCQGFGSAGAVAVAVAVAGTASPENGALNPLLGRCFDVHPVFSSVPRSQTLYPAYPVRKGWVVCLVVWFVCILHSRFEHSMYMR